MPRSIIHLRGKVYLYQSDTKPLSYCTTTLPLSLLLYSRHYCFSRSLFVECAEVRSSLSERSCFTVIGTTCEASSGLADNIQALFEGTKQAAAFIQHTIPLPLSPLSALLISTISLLTVLSCHCPICWRQAMANTNQYFLLADHIKLSLLERQRAVSLNLEPTSQDGHISRSLDSLREGLESISQERIRLQESGDSA